MKTCSHCNVYEPHDSRGWCRRCICAHVADRGRFERLRWPGWPTFVWECVVHLVKTALGRESPT